MHLPLKVCLFCAVHWHRLIIPFLSDTSEEPIYYKIFRDYDGSVAGAVICGIAYILIGGGHSWFMIRNRSWWSWCLPLGAVCALELIHSLGISN